MAVINKTNVTQAAVIGVTAFYNKALPETSNNSTTVYSTKLTLTTPSTMPLGNYILQYQFQWRSSTADREIEIDIQQNAATILNWEPTTSRIQDRQLLSGFYLVQNISGVNDFTFRFRVANSAATMFVKECRFLLTRIL